MQDRTASACWCGSAKLEDFSPDYLHCSACESLVARDLLGTEIALVQNDDQDFYGRSYWYARQEQVHGYPNLEERAWLDIPERCVHWLTTLLKYKRPPGRILEIGCAHGAFVALLQWTGFDAAGLELSPSVAEFARTTFGIPVYHGPVEQQGIAPGSLDMIVLMDVIEHLRDPVATMRHCLHLLRDDGMLLIQTPKYPAGISYRTLADSNDIFLKQLKAGEHLFLFSESAVRSLFTRLDAKYVRFEPAIYAYYDQFFIAARSEPAVCGEPIRNSLNTPSGRMVQSLLVAAGEREDMRQRWRESQTSEGNALERLHDLRVHVDLLDEDRNKAWAEVEKWRATADAYAAGLANVTAERDRTSQEAAAHLATIGEYRTEIDQDRVQIGEYRAQSDEHRVRIEELRAHTAALESRLEELTHIRSEQESAIEDQLDTLRSVRLELAETQTKHNHLIRAVEAFRESLLGRALRRLGLVLPRKADEPAD